MKDLIKKIDKIADECLYSFPPSYTNSQIIAFQKGIDKLWAKLKKELADE